MAVVTNTNPIADIHGAFAKGDKVIYRVRNGIQHAYIVKHPFDGEPTDKQKQARQSFKALTQQVKVIYADSEQLADWQQRFLTYTQSKTYKKALRTYLAFKRQSQHVPYQPLPKHLQPLKPPTTLYGYILSTLSQSTSDTPSQSSTSNT